MRAHTVRDYARRDRLEVTGVLARAFSIDPLFDHFSWNLLHQHLLLPGLMNAYQADLAGNGRCWVVQDADGAGRARGFAGWLPPDRLPRGTRRELSVTLRAALPIAVSARPISAVRLFTAIERHHPREPHWYLSVLAVDPTRQGHGWGKALIATGLAAADRDRLPCYLETQKFENLAWYARFGFDVEHEVSLAGMPTVWCLWRAPQ